MKNKHFIFTTSVILLLSTLTICSDSFASTRWCSSFLGVTINLNNGERIEGYIQGLNKQTIQQDINAIRGEIKVHPNRGFNFYKNLYKIRGVKKTSILNHYVFATMNDHRWVNAKDIQNIGLSKNLPSYLNLTCGAHTVSDKILKIIINNKYIDFVEVQVPMADHHDYLVNFNPQVSKKELSDIARKIGSESYDGEKGVYVNRIGVKNVKQWLEDKFLIRLQGQVTH